MASPVDQLKTVMAVAGQQNYMAAMYSAARATTNLERVTVNANKRMGQSADAYYDKQSNRMRDKGTGQFLAQKKMLGIANPAMAAATVLAAEVAILAAALRLAAAAFKEIGDAGRKFEAVMKDVEVQSGATAAEMVKIKEAALSQDLQNMGVGGVAAASAYQILAAEGYSVAEMQKAMVPITRVAVATGSDHVEVTKAMLAIMRQYGLALTDLPALGNAMTQSLNKTTFQMNDLMLAMKYAGPIAGNLGWSYGETVAVLDQLYKKLGNAEMVGTGFRGFMNMLMAPTTEMTGVLKEVGLSVDGFEAAMGDAGATLQWFQSGAWTPSLIMKAFGAEAGGAAQILWRTQIPAVQSTGDAINTMGNVAADVQKKMNSLDGAVLKLAASYEDLKIWLSSVTKGISVDFVQALTLAVQAIGEFAKEAATKFEATGGVMNENRDTVIELANAFVTGAAMVARGAIQVSRFIGMQAASLSTLGYSYNIARLAYLELAYAWAYVRGDEGAKSNLSDRIDGAKAAISSLYKFQASMVKWAYGGGASAAVKEVDNLEEKMLKKIRELREKALAEAKKAEMEGAAPLPQAKPQGQQPKIDTNDAVNLESAQEQLSLSLKQLAVWERMAKAKVTTPAQEAMVELAAREKELALLQEMERTTYRLTADQKARNAATLKRMEAEAGVMEANKRLSQDAAKLNEQERIKSAQDMERMTKAHKALNEAVQMVIGGNLSEQVRAQVERLRGIGENRTPPANAIDQSVRKGGWLDSVRATSNNTITLKLTADGPLSEQQVEQVMGRIMNAAQQAGTRPAFGR